MMKPLLLTVLLISTAKLTAMEAESPNHKYSPLINKNYEEDAFRLYQLGYAAYTATTSSPTLKAQNLKEARQLLTDATLKGEPNAAALVGRMWEYGEGGEKNIKEAEKFYLIAHKAGVSVGTAHLAALYQKNNQIEKAFHLQSALAEQGHPMAQIAVGSIYLEGSKGDFKLSPNFETAIQWYKKAADQGDLRADYALGRTYFLLKDYDTARLYLEKVCHDEHAEKRLGETGRLLLSLAKSALADIYGPKGYGKAEDAIQLYRDSIALGNKNADMRLKNFIALQARKERTGAEKNLKARS